MLKKIITVLATAALTVTGFTAMPASATTYAPNTNSTANTTSWNLTIPDNGELGFPSSARRIGISRTYEFSGTSLSDAYGKTVTFDWSITKPDNTVINSSNSQQNNFYSFHSASLAGNGSYHDIFPMGGSPVVISGPDEAEYERAQIRFSLSKIDWTGPAGVYTVSIVLKLDGVAYTNFTTSGPNSAYIDNNSLTIDGNSTVGTSLNVEYLGLAKVSIRTNTCVNTSTLSVGDVLTLRQIVDGSEIPSQASGVMRNIYAELQNATGSRYVDSDFNGTNYTVEVNQAILTSGLSIEASAEFLNPASSDPAVSPENSLSEGPHNVGLSVTNAAGAELTLGCIPATPATPVASLSGDRITASATGVFRSTGELDYKCEAFRASDGSALGIETYANTLNYDNTSQAFTRIECNSFFGIPGGTSVVVKIVAQNRNIPDWKSFSAASNSVTVPSNGITFTSTASNGNNFGQVKARTPIDLVSLSGGGTQFSTNVAEPTGGIFEFNRKGSNLTLRRIVATGLDSNFGTVPFTHTSSSYTFSAGFNGTLAAPRPIVSFLAQQVNPDLVLRDFTYQGAAGNTRTVTSSQLSSLCTSSFGSTFVEINRAFIVSTPTTDAYVQVGCSTPWSQNASSTEGWALVKVAMTGNSAPVLVTKLGTGTASFPGFSTAGDMSGPGGLPVSLDWSATGAQPMLTFVVTPQNQTCSMNGCSATYSSPKIVRIPANGGTATTTNSGISAPATNSGDDMYVGMEKINFGTILISKFVYGACPPCSGTESQFKATATGGATPLTVTWDTTAGISNASSVIDTTLGLTQDGQLVFVRGGNTAGTFALKMARLNLSTGAVTTFGELITYTRSGFPSITLSPLGGNSVAILVPSGVNAGKLDMLVGVGGGASEPVAPTVPTPNGGADTDLGRSLNTGGTKITIDGNGLSVVSKVLFGTVEAKFTKTATRLSITVPRGTAGTAPVTIVYSGGSVPVGDWEYVGAAKLAQTLTPTGLGDPTHSGASEADRNFTVASSLNGYSVTVVSKTPTICTYVSGVIDFIGNGTCILQASQAGDAVTNAASATYEIYYETTVVPSALHSTDAGRPTITITGEGLTAVSRVVFGNVEVIPTKKTATSITVRVPAAPTTGANVDLSLKYTNGTVVDTQLDFDFVGTAKLNQTVSLAAGFSTATYGDTARTLTASSVVTGTSNALENLPYVFASTTTAVCAVTRNQLRFLAGGTCTVRATQAGNAGVNAAAPVAFNITVSKKTQLISVIETAREITDVDGVNLDAENSNSEVLLDYVSTNESVCTVDGEGFVTGLSEGTCTVTIDAPADARYDAAPQKTITINVTVDNSTVVPESEAEIVDATPVAVSPGGVNSFISLADPSLQVSWDKATGKLTPRATGVYTGFITAEVKFTVAGSIRTCTTVFGSNAALKVPTKPVLAANPTARQTATYNRALASYNKAFKAAWGSKIFKSAIVCADGSKLTGTSFATLKRVAKTSAERRVEAANYKLLKNFTGDVTITVKRWRAWPTTAKNKKGNPVTGKTIPAVTNKYTLTLG
jgi:hypothetical protein